MPIGPYYFRVPDRYTVSSAVSYVTGSHAIKTGFQWGYGGNRHQRIIGTGTSGDLGSGLDLIQEYNCVASSLVNGVCGVRNPASVIVYNTPQWAEEKIKYDLGVYLQDSFTYKRLTINPGIRCEAFNTYVPEQGSPAGRFVPTRHFDEIKDLPNWRDVAPRFGAVYDVFDDGKTAVKFHVGKYMRAYSTVGFAAIYNPMVIATDRRTWTDTNGDDIAQDSEIGPVVNPFNISGISNRVADPDIKRPYQWEYNAGVQRELMPGVSVSAGWVRREFKRIFWTDNILVSQSDYSIVNIPNPCGTASAPAGCVRRGGGRDDSDLQPERGQARPGAERGQELRQELQAVQRRRFRVHRSRQGRQHLRRDQHRQAGYAMPVRSRIRTACASAIRPSSTSRIWRSSSWLAHTRWVRHERQRHVAGLSGRADRHQSSGRRLHRSEQSRASIRH